MDPMTSLFLALAFVGVIGYFLVMRVFFGESRALDARIDHSKMRDWNDEDDWK